ncbi:MAG: hypothetical protein D6698_11040 [Gammaproteobacteria bacterium]|nr:MAG: hypothetical protein D6698_11040 [Gammaproteobacteria bacterium]
MNTPAHAIINLLIFKKRLRETHALAIAAGAIVPDLPMILFYIWARAHHLTERQIWRETYYESHWQTAFDLFHSFPVCLSLAALAWYRNAKVWMWFFLSMALHSVFDLPVHHDDAHRHFIPFSNWQFISPISYWDPRYFGQYVSLLELATVLIGSIYFLRCGQSRTLKIITGLVLALYASHWIFVILFWIK